MGQTIEVPRQQCHAICVGVLNQERVDSVCRNLASASQQNVGEFHLMLQSDGGIITPSIALYNFIRALPLELHIYNAGYVGSSSVLVYLAARKRYVSALGGFFIHKGYLPISGSITAVALKSYLAELERLDVVMENILRENTTMPPDVWESYAVRDVHLTAAEALQFGIAHEIREFSLPPGGKVFHI